MLRSLDARAAGDRSPALRNNASQKNGGNSCRLGTRRRARNGCCWRVPEGSVKRFVTSRYAKEDFSCLLFPSLGDLVLLTAFQRGRKTKTKKEGLVTFVAVNSVAFFLPPQTSCLINFCRVLHAATMRHCFVT